MSSIKAVFFDVAHTLLEKPTVLPAIRTTLARHGIDVPMHELETRHRLLMEAIEFPDFTSRDFYADFNSAMIRAVGGLPSAGLLEEIFTACSYQPWAPYPDTAMISRIPLPKGVLSNWDKTLKEKLDSLLDVQMEWILGSAEQDVRKPNPDFFRLMLGCTGLRPEEIAYVGDSMRLDIEPSLRMGFKGILLDRGNIFPYSPLPRIRSLDQLESIL